MNANNKRRRGGAKQGKNQVSARAPDFADYLQFWYNMNGNVAEIPAQNIDNKQRVIEPRSAFRHWFPDKGSEEEKEFETLLKGKCSACFDFPKDIFKALFYSGYCHQKKLRASLPVDKHFALCAGIDCPKAQRKATKHSELCECGKPHWDYLNNDQTWIKIVELRYVSPDVNIGTFSRVQVRENEVLGEYFGEICPPKDVLSPYIAVVEVGKKEEDEEEDKKKKDKKETPVIVHIDAIRVGSWTRFINHSCRPTCEFHWCRVGKSANLTVRALKDLNFGEEITVDYGDKYWEVEKAQKNWV